MFSTVLVANRGEIAVRITRTLRRLGIRSAVVYSDADVDSRHVHEADLAVRVGPAEAALSYLSVDAIVAAALSVGADAVHPGYGFLAENADFARACASAGLVFVGPPPAAIEAMGDKIRAKQTVEAAGVAVVPGLHLPGLTDDDLLAAAGSIGFPVLLKPSGGGGGKGMRRVESLEGMPEAIAAARREARTSFGDDTLLIERFVDRPRHIEVQVLADTYGAVVHLGERECSLQRRHQKIVEEAPSPLLTAEGRASIGASAVRTAQACGYVGAGTVEFIVAGDAPDAFYFMEMNTRLQVEHPVTELVMGLDLVEQQLRVAAGEALPWGQDDLHLTGHAVEARVYAEDPARDFLPTGGTVLRLREPAGDHVRVDSGISEGSVIGSSYDPMLAKIIAWGADRAEALARLESALAETVVLGVGTNVAFLGALLADADVRAGRLDTGLVERRLADLVRHEVPDEVLRAAVLAGLAERARDLVSDNPFETLADWRLGGPTWVEHRLSVGPRSGLTVSVRGSAASAELRVGEGDVVSASAILEDDDLLVTEGGRTSRWAVASARGVRWLGRAGRTWAIRDAAGHVVHRVDEVAGAGPLLSPMPGTVTAVHVALGDAVVAGTPVVSVEAMKMEHVMRAAGDGVIVELPVSVGETVLLDQVVARVGGAAPTSSLAPTSSPTP
ncbi:MAG TPA: biotin carboxylase N-terminal domain-containing protein [Candidatus Limnocylindria bacterium]|nr:biotin carboxylase N-terminal domain-containing protein [Candidatus Limnocylindria bacterium]